MLQALIDKSQEFVTGRVRRSSTRARRGSSAGRIIFVRRSGSGHVEGRAVAYDRRDAGGFIRLNALRLRTLAKRARRISG